MHAAAPAAAPGERDIERFFGEARLELPGLEIFPAGVERGLELLLGGVDALPEGFFFLGRKSAELLQERGQLPALAQVLRLGILEGSGLRRSGEVRERPPDDFLEIIQCERLAFTCPAILANAGLSSTARSASSLRSISMFAFFSPDMNAL